MKKVDVVVIVVLGIVLFCVLSVAVLNALSLKKPANFTEFDWDMDHHFYAARESNLISGDYIFFYVTEFSDNPKAYSIMSQRMSGQHILNGMTIDNKKIDNQTFISGLIFWYYDGEKMVENTHKAINSVSEDSLIAKADNFEFNLNGNYPSYSFNYTAPGIEIDSKLLDAGLSSLKAFEINKEGSQQKYLENDGMKVVNISTVDSFRYYNTSRKLFDFGKGGYSLVEFLRGPYISSLIQDIYVPVESKVNDKNLSGVIYMESVWGKSGIPLEWVLLSSWFKNGSHFWFIYYPDMWPFSPTYRNPLCLWFYEAETQKMHLFNKFHWQELNEDGVTRFVLEAENTVDNTRVEITAKVLATHSSVWQKMPFFLHKYTYKQMPSKIEKFTFYSPEYNRTLEELGPSAGYSEKSSLTGFNLKKEYSK